MRNQLVIELVHGPEIEISADLLEAAYRASALGAVAVVLPLALRRQVDRLLDPVVARVGPTPGGIRYVEAADEAAIHMAVSTSRCAVPATAAFRTRCESLGVPVLEVDHLVARFRLPDARTDRQPLTSAPLFRSVQVSPVS